MMCWLLTGSDIVVLKEWMDKLTDQDSKVKLSDEQKIEFLKIAENAKGSSKYMPEIRQKLATLYHKTGQYEKAVDYLNILYETAQTTESKKAILPDLLDACLKGANKERLAELVKICLVEGDLDSNSIVVKLITNYFDKPPIGADTNEVLKQLIAIKVSQNRPQWNRQIKSWTDLLGKAQEANKQNRQSS